MRRPVSLHPITEAIDEAMASLNELGGLDNKESEAERKKLMEVLEKVKQSLKVACKTGSYVPTW